MKSNSSFVCQQCGGESAKWMGKCPHCGAWNSLVETTRFTGKQRAGKVMSTQPVSVLPLSGIKRTEADRITTGIKEFDRVLGGGIVPGSVMLLSGDPGVGKSTLLLAAIGKTGGIYVTGEESAEQVKLRAVRMGVNENIVKIISDTNIDHIIDAIKKEPVKTSLVIIDSIQTMAGSELDGIAGSVGQVRYSTQMILQLAKTTNIPVFIIGHVTKEGTIAGPRVLEHMVDVVCYFEGDRYYQGRILRTLKNRYGATDEVGIFEMVGEGLKEVSNPSELFLEGRVKGVAGSTVGVTMEGTRPLLVEIQSLVVPSQLAMPRRVSSGFDFNRLQVLLAILTKRLNLSFGNFDVFVNISGGMKLTEPAADLPVALSLISAFKNKALPSDLASFGELGLLGELRRVQGADKRIKEAQRLGFKTVLGSHISTDLVQLSKSI